MCGKIKISESIMQREHHPVAIAHEINRLELGLPISRIFLLAATFAAGIISSVYGADIRQEWIPSVLEFPDDAEVLIDREIGPSIRMLSITTAQDADELLLNWRRALEADGYVISETGTGSMEQAVEFSGGSISNAKIIVAPSSSEGRYVIEFDATLN